MSTIQRLAKNTAVLIGADLTSFIIGFFFTMYVARYLGAEGFGILSFALAFTAIFGLFTDIGLQQLMIREIARDKTLAQKYLGNIAVLKVFLAVLTFGAIALTINLLGYPSQTVEVVYLVALSVVLNAFSAMFYGVFRAYERMEFVALGQVLGSAITLAAALFAISQGFSVVGFAWIYLATSIVVLVYSLAISVRQSLVPRIELDLKFCKATIKQAWPFGLGAAFVTILFWIDCVMLSLIKGDQVVGWYSAAYRLFMILTFIPVAYFGAVFPVMSRLYASSDDSSSGVFFKLTYERSLKYMLLLSIPIGAGTTLLANKIIMLIYGVEYYNSIVALQILAWSSALKFVTMTFFILFNSVNKQIIVTWITGSATALNVVLNLILIPLYSYIGAAIATVSSSFLALALGLLWAQRIGYGIPLASLVKIIAKVLISTATMCLFVLCFKDFYILAVIASSALLYFIVLFIVRGIDKDDRDLLRSIIRQKLPGGVER